MKADVIETLVPEVLWKLFQRVVPSAPVRPHGEGRRRYGGREVLAAIIFVGHDGLYLAATAAVLRPVGGDRASTLHRLVRRPGPSVPFTSECPVESPVGGDVKLGAWTATRSIPSENYPAGPV